jgi:hypothetical protein
MDAAIYPPFDRSAHRPRSYDIGIAGGVVAMPEFQKIFFPHVRGGGLAGGRRAVADRARSARSRATAAPSLRRGGSGVSCPARHQHRRT